MEYSELLAKLEEIKRPQYLYYKYCRDDIYEIFGEIYSKTCQIIESIPDEKINEILQTKDVIKSINIFVERIDGKLCYRICFTSDLKKMEYNVYVPADDPHDVISNFQRIEILVQERALKLHTISIFLTHMLKASNSVEELKKILGGDYIRSDRNTITVKNTFFD